MTYHNIHYKLIYHDITILQHNRSHIKDLIVIIATTTEIFQWMQSDVDSIKSARGWYQSRVHDSYHRLYVFTLSHISSSLPCLTPQHTMLQPH